MAEKKSTSKKAPTKKKVSAKIDPAPVKPRNAFRMAQSYKRPVKRPRKG